MENSAIEQRFYRTKDKNKGCTGGDGRAHTPQEMAQEQKYADPNYIRTCYTHPAASGK